MAINLNQSDHPRKYTVKGHLIVAGPTTGKSTMSRRRGGVDTDDIILSLFSLPTWRAMSDDAKNVASRKVALFALGRPGYIFTNLWYPAFLSTINGRNAGEVYVYRANPERILELMVQRGARTLGRTSPSTSNGSATRANEPPTSLIGLSSSATTRMSFTFPLQTLHPAGRLMTANLSAKRSAPRSPLTVVEDDAEAFEVDDLPYCSLCTADGHTAAQHMAAILQAEAEGDE